MRRRVVRDEIDVGDMRREGREVLLDGLVVADVGEDRVENWQLGTVGGDRDAALRHQRQQANGLQPYRLAAGVRAGDDELPMFTVEFHGERNDGNALRLERPLQ